MPPMSNVAYNYILRMKKEYMNAISANPGTKPDYMPMDMWLVILKHEEVVLKELVEIARQKSEDVQVGAFLVSLQTKVVRAVQAGINGGTMSPAKEESLLGGRGGGNGHGSGDSSSPQRLLFRKPDYVIEIEGHTFAANSKGDPISRLLGYQNQNQDM